MDTAEEVVKEEVSPEEKKIEGYTEQQIDEMCQSALRLVRVYDDNTVSIKSSLALFLAQLI